MNKLQLSYNRLLALSEGELRQLAKDPKNRAKILKILDGKARLTFNQRTWEDILKNSQQSTSKRRRGRYTRSR